MSRTSFQPDIATPEPGRSPRGVLRWPSARRVATSVSVNVSLAVFVGVACLSLLRIFVNTDLLVPILIGLASGLGVPSAGRLVRVPAWFSLLASTLVEAVVLCAWFTSRTNSPFNLAAFGEARQAMVYSLEQVNAIVAPSPSLIGFGIVVSLVSWMVGLTADFLCFEVPSPLGALTTPAAVAVVAATIAPRNGGVHDRTWLFAQLLALGFYVISIGLQERARRTNWFGNKPGSLLQTALVLGLVFSGLGLAAHAATERLGFDERTPSLDLRVSRQTQRQRVITSPLVSLRRRLLSLSGTEQFSVASKTADGGDAPSYWRLTALDEFNGESWQSTGEFRKVTSAGTLESRGAASGTVLQQNYLIGDLGSESLPAAYEPLRYNGPLAGVAFAIETQTLLAKGFVDRNTSYNVTSGTPRNLDPDRLETYDPVLLADDPGVRLPATFPVRVRDLALAITEDRPTAIEKARALQDFFRTRFEYSLDIPPGSSEPALQRFLFSDRRGYCEQFAGAFAAMARSVGIPARVAVGFTPGRLDPVDGRYHVTGKNAHAWPEIRLADGSWFPFEPTPGRGFPGLEATTGVVAQDQSEPVQTPVTTTTVTTAAATTVVSDPVPPVTTPPATDPPAGDDRPAVPLWSVAVLLAALAAGASGVLWRHRRRTTGPQPGGSMHRSGGRSPSHRVEKAWTTATNRLNLHGRAAETETAIATRFCGAYPELPELAELTQRARYADHTPAEIADTDAVRAEELAKAMTAGHQPPSR